MVGDQNHTPARIAFFKLIVADLDRAERFFAAAFGLVRRRELATPDLIERILECPGEAVTLILFHWRDARPIEIGSGHGPVGLFVDDIDASIARSVAAGATLLRGPIDMPIMRIAFLGAPDGHEIELLQRRTTETI